MDATALERALEPVSSALAADGYLLTARVEPGGLAVRIAAGPDACEDCLVPRALMARMIDTALAGAGLAPGPVELVYPNESGPVP